MQCKIYQGYKNIRDTKYNNYNKDTRDIWNAKYIRDTKISGIPSILEISRILGIQGTSEILRISRNINNTNIGDTQAIMDPKKIRVLVIQMISGILKLPRMKYVEIKEISDFFYTY